ncbi:MAG: NfeD family protein [Bacteroidales bacterium]|nr:NfeD family protein [Bacteroidales bacterium]MCF8333217.1 NfeD family protein [Bacteroidales bacterium]
MTLLITLIVLGLLFLLLEILVIPGTTVAGIIGSGLIVVAIWQTYEQYGSQTGIIFLGSTVLVTVVVLYFALKGKTWRRLMLNSEIQGKVEHFEKYQPKVGDEGVTISRLSPMGKARFNDDYYEVKSYSGYIDPNTSVKITKIESNKIIVKPKNT